MKTLAQFRAEFENLSETVRSDTLSEAAVEKFPLDLGSEVQNIPPLIILKRRAIRTFGDGQKVALYWADKLNKFVTIPYGSFGLSEGILSAVRKGAVGGAVGVADYVASKADIEKNDDGKYEYKGPGAKSKTKQKVNNPFENARKYAKARRKRQVAKNQKAAPATNTPTTP